MPPPSSERPPSEVRNQGIHAFSQSIATSHKLGLVNTRLLEFVTRNARKLNDAIEADRDREFEYFGLRTVYDLYLLKHPKSRLVVETPQQFFLRIAYALSESVGDAIELYELFSRLEYLPSSPTLFNSGTKHEQLSSCFLLDSPDDHLENIYQRAREPGDVRGLPVSAAHTSTVSPVSRPARLLDPGQCLTLRPMVYPQFFEMYRAAIKNTWTVEEIDFATDVGDLQKKMTPAEKHLVHRLVAFFATGDSIVANNLVLNLYKHINAPEARMYLSRQIYEEALHVQFYLTLLDTYVPDPEERHRAFAAVENIPAHLARAATTS